MLGALSCQEGDVAMDAYEGKTVRLNPVCPMCHGGMEAGYLLDRGDSNSLYQSEWAAGEPERGRWWMMGAQDEGRPALCRKYVTVLGVWLPRSICHHTTQ